jgi:WD40 repeat protein
MKQLCLILPVLLLLAGCSIPPVQPPNVVIENTHGGGSELAFNSETTLLASGGWAGMLKLWSVPEGKLVRQWQAHVSTISHVSFLQHQPHVLTASYDGSMALWSSEGQLLQRIPAGAPVSSMAVAEDAGLLITGHTDGSVRTWQYPGFQLLARHNLHQGEVMAVALHGASATFASGGDDRRVYFWLRGNTPRELEQPSSDTRALAFNTDGSILTGSGWYYLYDWHLPDGQYRSVRTDHGGIINDLQYSHDNRYIVSISRQTDSAIKVLDARSGKTIKSLQPHNLCGTSVRYSPNERYIASSSDDATIYIWDMQQPLPLTTYYKMDDK